MSLFAAAADPGFTVPIILLDISLMALLVVVAFAIVKMRSLFAIVSSKVFILWSARPGLYP